MPPAPKRICTFPGCSRLTTSRRCDLHQRAEQRTAEARRGTAAERGYTSAWRKAAQRFLAEHPLCATCKAVAIVEAAEVVDHVIPHRGDLALFWDEANWQSLSKRCHSRKTAAEDGAFGNPRGDREGQRC